MTTMTSFGSLDELRRAVRAMRADRPVAVVRPVAPADRWSAATDERVVLVCGCGGSAGATTIALALATVAGRARVVEACGGSASGLAFAASVELGMIDGGWLRGARDEVVVERRADSVTSLDTLPAPSPSDLPVTIVDSSWDIADVLASSGWLGDLARSSDLVVLVAPATVPGFRRLEAAIELVGESRALAATVGAKRWPRPVERTAGAALRRLRADGRVVHVAAVPALAISGLTPDPLPPALTRPALTLLTLEEGLRS